MIEDKSNNLLYYGLGLGVVLFVVYLIVKEHNKTLLAAINIQPTVQPQPQQFIQPVQQSIPQSNDNLLMQQLMIQTQELQNQTRQINDTLTFQNQELQLLHELQLKQQQNISNLESIKCSNVVSMNSNPNPSQIINTNQRNLKSNTNRENDEYISNTKFGMS